MGASTSAAASAVWPQASLHGLCAGHKAQQDRGQELRPIRPKMNRPFRHRTKQGYLMVRAPEGHPNAKRNGTIFEQVLVMSEMLGRPLRKGETVHHKDNIKHDNRPENLELWAIHQPRGARVADMVAWARWLLGQYGDIVPEESR